MTEFNNKNINDWVKERYKRKIDKESARHPIMNIIKTRADDKVLQMFNENERPKSVFDSNVEPTKFDHLIFPLNMKYQQVKNVIKESNIIGKLKNKYNSLKSYYHYMNSKIDAKYEISEQIFQENKKNKQINQKSNPKNKKKEIIVDPLTKILLEKEKENKFIQKKLNKMKIANFFKHVLFIKTNSVVEIEPKVEKIPNTIFYKLYRIAFNKPFTSVLKTSLIPFAFIFCVFKRYSENKENAFFFNKDTKFKQKESIVLFDPKTDKFFENILNWEKQLLYSTFIVEDLKETSEKLKSEFNEALAENYITSNNLFYIIRTFPYMLSTLTIPSYFIYKKFIKKRKFSQFYKNLIILSFLLFELSDYINFIVYLRYRLTLTNLLLGPETNTQLKYSFYRNNYNLFI